MPRRQVSGQLRSQAETFAGLDHLLANELRLIIGKTGFGTTVSRSTTKSKTSSPNSKP